MTAGRLCRVQGHRMALDRHDTLALRRYGAFEPLATALLPRLVKKCDVVIDVGANIGYYTLLCARLVGNEGVIYAFEPEPESYRLLERNAKLNGYRNIIPQRKALGARCGTTPLWVNLGSNQGDHRIYDPRESNRTRLEVEVVALDDMLPSNTTVKFVKIDIQGAEPLAVRGMERVLARSRGAHLLTEFWPFGLRQAGLDPAVYLDHLADLGFNRLFEVDEAAGSVRAVESRSLLQRYCPSEDRFTNLLCVR